MMPHEKSPLGDSLLLTPLLTSRFAFSSQLSREMKRKEEEMDKREREWEKTKVKNEELQRRIRNANVARAAGAKGGRKPAVPTKNNATPLGNSTSPN